MKTTKLRTLKRNLISFTLLLLYAGAAYSTTAHIYPNITIPASYTLGTVGGSSTYVGGGGFEMSGSSATFANNGWSVANGNSTDNPTQWILETLSSGTFSGNNCGFISDDGSTWTYSSTTTASYTHLYRRVEVNSSEKIINLSFDWLCNAVTTSNPTDQDFTYDGLQVAVIPVATTPQASLSNYASTTNVDQNGSVLGGTALLLTPGRAGFLNGKTSAQCFHTEIPSTFAGTPFYLVFSWRNNNSDTYNKPAAIDNVMLVSDNPVSGHNYDKTLFVEFFGVSIFNVDEDGDNVYEREDALLQYALDHGYKNFILKKIDDIKTVDNTTPTPLPIPFFDRGAITPTVSLSTAQIALEARLAAFLNKAHSSPYNIRYIGAGSPPTFNASTPTENWFFDNINEFNKRQKALHSGTYCFDIIFTEADYWSNEPNDGLTVEENFDDYFTAGLVHMKDVKDDSWVSGSGYHPLIVSTYVGDFKALVDETITNTTPRSAQEQADVLEANVNWLFVDFYFNGNLLSQSPERVNAIQSQFRKLYFFHRESGLGNRLESINATATHNMKVLPLFGGQSSGLSGRNYFGDYLKNKNGHVYDQNNELNWYGYPDNLGLLFNIYKKIPNPFSGQTNSILIEYPNIDYSEGFGWFKYGAMPDADHLFQIGEDPTTPVQSTEKALGTIEFVTNGGHNPFCTNCNDINDATGLNASKSYSWYKYNEITGRQDLKTGSISTFDAAVLPNVTDYYTCVATFDDQNAQGTFGQLQVRDEVKFVGAPSLIVGLSDPYWVVSSVVDATCPNYNNGSGDITLTNCSCTVTSYHWQRAGYSDIITTTGTLSGLDPALYTVAAYCGGSPCSVVNSLTSITYNPTTLIAINGTINTPAPKIKNESENYNCNPLLSTDDFTGGSYQWKLNGTNISGATNQTYTATQNGNYSVTVTVGSCSGTSDSYVLLMDPTPIISGSDITCLAVGETNKVYTVTEDLNGASYDWTLPSGVTASADGYNSIAITSWGSLATTGGIISCEVTNACINSTTAYFTVKGCCTSDPDDLNNETLTLTGTPQTFTGDFSINGTLELTGSGILEIDGADVTLNKGAKILVGSNCTLKVINNSHLYSCSSDKWAGIVLAEDAVLEVNSSMIENAQIAISTEDETAVITIVSSLFNDNSRSIYVNGTGSSSVFAADITNSVFTSRHITYSSSISSLVADLKGTNGSININSKTKSSVKSETAIELNEVGVSASSSIYNFKVGDETGSYSSLGNLFDHHYYGVKASNSNVEIVNNVFQEMSGNDRPPISTGIGVYAVNGSSSSREYWLKVGGSATNEKNTFLDCGTGVLAKEFNHAIVSGNLITKTQGLGSYSGSDYVGRFGIKLVNTYSSFYDCNSNTITNIYDGIVWAQNGGADVECNFNSNTISTSATTEDCFAAIYLSGSGDFEAKSCVIHVESNSISNVENGIKILNFKNSEQITASHNSNILLRNENIPQYGVYVANCKNVEVTDNSNIHSSGSSNKFITGVFLANTIFGTINCNTISNLGTCLGISGYSPNTANEGILHKNYFSYYSTAVSIMPNTAIFSQGSSSFASDNEWSHTGAGLYTVDIRNLGTASFYVRNTSLPYKPTFVQGTVGFSVAGANSNVSCSGTSSPGGVVLTTEEKFLMTKLAIDDIVYPVLPTEAKWYFSRTSYEKILKDTTLTSSDSILLDFKDSIENANIGKFCSVEESILSENWSQAETDNQSITYENHIEDNLKKYNEYYIAFNLDTTLGGDTTWVDDMISNLSPIAAECYTTGGPATIAARTMLSYFSNEIYEDDEDCFRIPSDSLIADSTNTLCGLVKGYHVPATTGATYTWTVPSGTSYTQTANSISVNWGTVITSGGTITCFIMDASGNSSYSTYTQAALTTSPTCVTVTANNTSCISATNLSWTTPAGCAAGYYIMFGTNGGGTTVPNNILDSLDVGNVNSYMFPFFLSPGITHYYKVIPYNNSHVPVSGCSIGSFTSGSSVSFTPVIGTPYIQNFDGVTAPALPCGITTTDENFPQDAVTWKTSTGAPCSGSNSMAIAKNPNNTTAKDDWFYSNPLNLTAGELYRVKYNRRGESTHTESIETYVQVSNDAATMLTSASIINSNGSGTSCSSDSGDFIASTTNQYFVGLHANSAANQGTLYIDDLSVSLIKTTHLTTSSCGDSLNTCDTIHCITYTGATSYKFKFEDLSISFSQEYTVTTASPKVYQFLGTNPLELGHTYSVSVSATTGGGIWSPYGSVCTVYIKPVPTTGLTGASCGSTLTDLSTLIYTNTNGICLINDYKYEFTDQSNSVVIETQRNSATTSFLLTYITTPYVKYSTTYSVKVKLKIGNTWGSYGSACNVTTPASPLTQLSSSYCNTTLSNFNSTVTSNTVLGVQDYRYHITGPSSYDKTFTRNSASNGYNFYWTKLCCGGQNMLANTTYDVEVASLAGGVWSAYGTSCTITTPSSVRLADTSTLQELLQPDFENEVVSLSMNVFPNPNNFDEEFSIELKGITESNQKIKFSISNMIGASVYRADIITKDENRVVIQPEIRLASGVYSVEAEINGMKLRKKFVVN